MMWGTAWLSKARECVAIMNPRTNQQALAISVAAVHNLHAFHLPITTTFVTVHTIPSVNMQVLCSKA